jgi:dolichol-phosphate mannosyltransferase
MKVVSVVVPVYRNESTLAELYVQIANVFEQLFGIELELCFVDDGSDDASFELIQKISKQDARVCYLSFDRNYGQVAAIIAGLRHCNGDAAIVVSADLQDPPEMILEMIRTWEGGSVVTISHRKSREDRFVDKFFSAVFYGTMKLIYPLIPKGGFDFFLLDRSALLVFNAIDRGGRFIQGDVVKLKLPIVFLPYERMSRKAGKSQWTFKRKLLYAFDAITYCRSLLTSITTTGSVLLFCGLVLLVGEFKPSYLFLLFMFPGFMLSVFGFLGKVYRSFNDQMKPGHLYTIASKSIR